jgi:hypothetical protein
MHYRHTLKLGFKTDTTQQCYINNPNPLFSKVHLTDLNLNNFKVVEAMGFKIIALRSP